jgi:hypothetical protein
VTPVPLNRRRYALLAGLGAGALLVLTPIAAATAATTPAASSSTMTVHLKKASLTDHSRDCATGQFALAHIILNQIAPASAVPATITVTTTSGSASVSLAKYVGKTAHYDATLNGGTITDAVASVPKSWTGQFVLSHYECGTPTTTTTTTTTTSTTTTTTTTRPSS